MTQHDLVIRGGSVIDDTGTASDALPGRLIRSAKLG